MKIDFTLKVPCTRSNFQIANILTSNLLQKEIFKQKDQALLLDYQINPNMFSVSRVKSYSKKWLSAPILKSLKPEFDRNSDENPWLYTFNYTKSWKNRLFWNLTLKIGHLLDMERSLTTALDSKLFLVRKPEVLSEREEASTPNLRSLLAFQISESCRFLFDTRVSEDTCSGLGHCH